MKIAFIMCDTFFIFLLTLSKYRNRNVYIKIKEDLIKTATK